MAVDPQIYEDPQSLVSLLGTWWSRTYEARDQVYALAAARQHLERQSLVALEEFNAGISRYTVPVFNIVDWVPLQLLQSRQNIASSVYAKYDTGLKYDNGWNYNQARRPPGYAFNIDPAIVTIPTLMNAITNPTRVFVYGADFVIEDGSIVFRDDIFTDAAITSQAVYDGEQIVDREILLWAHRAEYDRAMIFRQFGYVVGQQLPSSAAYRDLVNSSFDALIGGASIATFRQALSAVTGVPVVKGTETVVDAVQTAANLMIITDKNVYKFHPDDTTDIVIGQQLQPDQLLTTAVQLHECGRGTVPASMQALVLDRSLLAPCMLFDLVFVNEEIPLQVDTKHPSGFTYVSWQMPGFPGDVEAFFDTMHVKGVAKAHTAFDACDTRIRTITYPNNEDPAAAVTLQLGTLAHFLDKRQTLIGEPAATDLPTTINPLQLLVQTVLRNNTAIAVIDAAKLPAAKLGLQNLQFAMRMLSPHTLVLVLLDLTAPPTSVTVDLVETTIAAFTGAEPFAIDVVPDMVAFGQPVVRVVDESCQ